MSIGYTIQEVHASHHNKDIYGLYYRPSEQQQKRLPLVIFAHGFGGTHTYVIDEAVGLSKQGYGVYVFDFCGGGIGCQSSGSMMEMSVISEVEDMEAVLYQMRQRDDVDPAGVYLGGESQGGLVAAITAARNTDVVSGLILYYPAFQIVDEIHQRFQKITDIPESFEIFGLPVGRRYAEDIWNLDVQKEIQGFDHHVLILHGDRDEIVPLAYSEKMLDVYPHAKLIVVEGAGHGFYGEHDETAVGHILDDLKKVEVEERK